MESEKVGLKLNIQKSKIMASGPTTSWEIDGELRLVPVSWHARGNVVHVKEVTGKERGKERKTQLEACTYKL